MNAKRRIKPAIGIAHRNRNRNHAKIKFLFIKAETFFTDGGDLAGKTVRIGIRFGVSASSDSVSIIERQRVEERLDMNILCPGLFC